MSPMNRPRGYHSSCKLPDGRVLVSGGFSSPATPDWNDSEIYDPELNEWSMAGSMRFPRHNHESTLLENGFVLITGGSNCQTGMCHSGIEYFDPEREQWHDTYQLAMGRKWNRATLLESGDVLISGGKACNYPEVSTDIFHPPSSDGAIREGRNTGSWFLLVGVVLFLVVANVAVAVHIRR